MRAKSSGRQVGQGSSLTSRGKPAPGYGTETLRAPAETLAQARWTT